MPSIPSFQNKPKKSNNATLAENLSSEAMANKRTALWLKNNKEAIDSSNAFVDKHGLPLAKYRMF